MLIHSGCYFRSMSYLWSCFFSGKFSLPHLTDGGSLTKADQYFQSVRRFLLTNTVWKLISSMYLVFIITQDEMKKLVLEKNEIVNISKSEPHVESYVNDEL